MQGGRSMLIIWTVSAISHRLTSMKMGKQTVDECVENEANLAKLGELEMDYALGYVFGYPQPLPKLVAQLSQRKEVL